MSFLNRNISIFGWHFTNIFFYIWVKSTTRLVSKVHIQMQSILQYWHLFSLRIIKCVRYSGVWHFIAELNWCNTWSAVYLQLDFCHLGLKLQRAARLLAYNTYTADWLTHVWDRLKSISGHGLLAACRGGQSLLAWHSIPAGDGTVSNDAAHDFLALTLHGHASTDHPWLKTLRSFLTTCYVHEAALIPTHLFIPVIKLRDLGY